MHPSHILYAAFHNNATMPPEDNLCTLCGSRHGVEKASAIIKASFTNRDVLRAPDSDFMCHACAFALKTPAFRQKSFLCTNVEFVELPRETIAETLFNNLPLRFFICCVTTSYKKHLWLNAHINAPAQDEVIVRYDETNVQLNPRDDAPLFNTITTLYSHFTKDEIKSGNYPSHKVQKCCPARFTECEEIIAESRHQTPLKLDFLVYIANKMEGPAKWLLKEHLIPATKPTKQRPSHGEQLSLF